MIENKNITEVFNALNSQIALHKGCPLSLVVCGGTALCALGLILRTTKDVDVLGELLNENNVLTIKPLDAFPDWLIQSATIVQRDFNLSTNWLNTGPKSQLELGLPHGFVERLIKKSYGTYLVGCGTAAYAALASWRQDRMVSRKAFIPYHPGAIKFYKEKGVWNKQMDDLQAKRLAQ